MQKLVFNTLLLFYGTLSLSNTDWELQKNLDGIKVYTRSVDDWDIQEFKVITILNVKRYIIFDVLMNVAEYSNWYPDIIESQVLNKVSNNEIYCYSKIDVPWPSTDRDGESHFKAVHNNEDKTTIISMEACSKYKAKQEGYIRMTKGYGFWKLTSKGDQTVVHYQYLSDPGGSIPAWLINMFIVDNPYNTVKALKEKVNG